jgi:hypothetical protein
LAVYSIKADAAGAWIEIGDGAQEQGFACARRAANGHAFAIGERECYGPQARNCEVFDLEHILGRIILSLKPVAFFMASLSSS